MLGRGNVPEHPGAVERPAVVGADDARVAIGALDRIRDPAPVQGSAAVRAHVRDGLDFPVVPCVAEEGEAAAQGRDPEGLAVVLDVFAQGDGVPKVFQVGAAAGELSRAATQGVGGVEGAGGEAGALAAVGEGRGGRRRRRGGVLAFVVDVGVVVAAELPLPLLLSREDDSSRHPRLLLQRRRRRRKRILATGGDLDGPGDAGAGRGRRRGLEHRRRRELRGRELRGRQRGDGLFSLGMKRRR